MVITEKLLAELIAVPSVNPAFLPLGDPRAGEQRVAEYLAAIAAREGLDVELQEVLARRPNLVARLQPAGSVRRRLWLVPHLDTVNGSDAQFRPGKLEGRLFGRGACDTKGSIAAMMAALCRLAKERKRPAHTEVTLVGVIDEENAQAGSRALAASKLKPDLAIVGEPTRLQVVTAHKGSVWLRLETRGKSAHGACPNLGRNAVHAMSRIVDLLEGKYAARLRRKRHPLLGSPTISVGVIAGGTQPNIVPDSCRIDVDRRTLRAVYSSFKLAPCLPLETNPKHPLVAQFLESVGQKKAAGVHYFCDASVLAHGGIPSVVFGPGDIAQAHTADEWISLSALERGSALLLRFLQSLP